MKAKMIKFFVKVTDRIDYLEHLLDMHEKYELYQKINAEYWKLRKAEETNKGKGGFLGYAKKSVAQEYKAQYCLLFPGMIKFVQMVTVFWHISGGAV